MCFAACERWKLADNVSAENGVFYPLSSVADCMDLCLSDSNCVAIDIWSDTCSLHRNASDLISSRVTSGVSQFVLDRSCPVSTIYATTLKTVSTTLLPTTGAIVSSVTVCYRNLSKGTVSFPNENCFKDAT